jgi:hypothetical protein
MLTFMQLKTLKSKGKLTQKERAQIVDIETARKSVQQSIEEAIAAGLPTSIRLYAEMVDRISNNQPVHFDDMGYVPHWFERQDIEKWITEIKRNRKKIWP